MQKVAYIGCCKTGQNKQKLRKDFDWPLIACKSMRNFLPPYWWVFLEGLLRTIYAMHGVKLLGVIFGFHKNGKKQVTAECTIFVPYFWTTLRKRYKISFGRRTYFGGYTGFSTSLKFWEIISLLAVSISDIPDMHLLRISYA